MKDAENLEKPRSEDSRGGNRAYEQRRPFDISDLEQISPTTDDDPPYQRWWVLDASADLAER